MAEITLRSIIDYDSEQSTRIQDLVEFDGPPTYSVGATPYVALTQFGIKAEGTRIYPDATTRHWTEAEAVFHFRRALWDYLVANPAQQIAWRQRPHVEQREDGDFVVRCRFALLQGAK